MATSYGEPVTGERRTRDRTYAMDSNQADERFGPEGWSPEEASQRSRIVLTPVAAPSILGLFGYFAATLLIGAYLAGWWGGTTAPVLVFPFVVMLGGVAQFTAGVWAYRARDGLATAMHGIWGGFWLAFGLYQLLVATGNLPMVRGPLDVAFGFWFIPLAAITLMGAMAATARNGMMFAVLACLTAGSVFAAVGYIAGIAWCLSVAGWLFVFSAGFAWYEAGAMMMRAAFGRTVLPTLDWKIAANVPGRTPERPVQYAEGMPGSRAGQ